MLYNFYFPISDLLSHFLMYTYVCFMAWSLFLMLD